MIIASTTTISSSWALRSYTRSSPKRVGKIAGDCWHATQYPPNPRSQTQYGSSGVTRLNRRPQQNIRTVTLGGRYRPSTSPIPVGSCTGIVRMWLVLTSLIPDRLSASLKMLNYGPSGTALAGNGATHCGTLRADLTPVTFND
jgi:hypothetical protein